jgi:hypothetical protein
LHNALRELRERDLNALKLNLNEASETTTAASSSMCFDLDLKLKKKKISILHQLLDLLFNQRTLQHCTAHRDDANSVISSTNGMNLK